MAEQWQFKRVDDGLGNFVLYFEDIVELAVIGFRPQVKTVIDLDQLRRDTRVVAGFAH